MTVVIIQYKMKLSRSLQKKNTIRPDDIEKQKVKKVSLNFFGEQNDKLYTGSKLGLFLSLSAFVMVMVYLGIILR